MIPATQRMTLTGGSLFLPYTMRLDAPQWPDKACRCASLLLDAVVTSGEDPHVVTRPAPLPPEGYRLTVADTVTVEYSDYPGLCHGLATLSGLLTATEGGYTLSRCVVEDAPAAKHRGVMLDVARGIQPLDELLDDMVLIARARMNTLHLHLFDSVGCAVALDCLPPALILEDHYTREDVAAIVDRADVLGLELIPEFDLPGHSRKMTAVFPDLACPVEGYNGGWDTCPGTEETFRLYEAIIREMVALFPGGRYFHVGGDELEFTDIPSLDIFCYWDNCPRCRRRMEQEGLADMRELYYYVMTRMNELVRSLGRRMIMWNDQIDLTRPCSLPRDILVHFWRIACPGRGPSEGTFADLADMGFSLINSHFLEAYIEEEGEMSEETIRDWRWDMRPGCAEEHRHQVMGGELCVWMYGPTADPKWDRHDFDFINRELPSAVMLMGDTLWTGREFTYDHSFYQALTRAVLGPHTPEGLNVFAAFGGAMPPKNNTTFAHHDKVTLSDEELADLEATLRRMPPHGRTRMYADAVAHVIEERKTM